MSKASAYFRLENIDGKHDVKELKRELNSLHGIISVIVNENTERIAVDYDSTGVAQRQIQRVIENLGYDVVNTRFENHMM